MSIEIFTAFGHHFSKIAAVGVLLAALFGCLDAAGSEKGSSGGHDVFIFAEVAEGTVPGWKFAGALEGWEKELSERVDDEVRVSIVSTNLGVAGLGMMKNSSVAVMPVVEMERCTEMIPEFLVEHREGLHSKFVLLAPGEGGMTSGEASVEVGLFDSTMVMPWSGRVWAHSVLPDIAICSNRAVRGSDRVVIPLFFGRAAYGVVDLSGFETEKRRNPQVEDVVRVIAESPRLLGDAVFMRKDLSASVAETFRRELVLSSKGKSGAVVFGVLGWHALRPIAEKEEVLIAESLAALSGEVGSDSTADAEVGGGKK